MAADGNVSNLVNTIVHYPAFKETLNAILSGSYAQAGSSVSPATVHIDNRSTNATSPIGSSICNTDRNQRQFHSPAQELTFNAEITRRFYTMFGLEDLCNIKE